MLPYSGAGGDGARSSGTWSRRLFLKTALLAAGAAAVGIGGWSRRGSIGRLLGARPDPRTQNSLTPQELDEVVLVSKVLFEPDDERESRELAGTVRWWAEGRTTRGPHLDLYRDGLRALENTTRDSHPETPFHDLSPADRSALIAALMGTSAEEPFRKLASELLLGIYSSAPGWHTLGYTTWPGVPSPPLEYTRRPGAPQRRAAASRPGAST